MPMTLGEKIWRLRESKNISQDQLAELLDVSRQTISNWENDKVTLDAEKLKKLCEVFGVSADEMLGESFPTPSSPVRKERRLTALFLTIASVVLFIIAAVGLALSKKEETISSVMIFYPFFIWIFLLLFGCGTLIAALIFFRKK